MGTEVTDFNCVVTGVGGEEGGVFRANNRTDSRGVDVDSIGLFANFEVEFSDFVVFVGEEAGRKTETKVGGNGGEGKGFSALKDFMASVFP